MNKRNIKTSGEGQYSFSGHKSYSIAEILAAGGATAFANKKGKSPATVVERLKRMPNDAFLTEEEAMHALETLNKSK
ncbi:MAG: hypothetical protein JWP45_1369 [Mucilaginibacter sp.]|nr:hypothetical protein [Mucilaginibacter sp.]